MPRAAALSQASAVNRRKAGKKSSGSGSGGVNLPNLPQFVGPPPGTFDPGLEAEVRAAERGLIDLIEKTRIDGHRESADTRQARILLERKVRQGHADLARRRGYAEQDAGTDRSRLQTSFERDLQDLATAKQQGEEDYQRKLTEVQQQYQTRAAVQQQASVAQGTNESGTEAASQSVRAANEAWDKGILNTQHGRFLAANTLAEQRDREDYARNQGLIGQNLGRDLTGIGIQDYRLGLEGREQKRKLRTDIQRGTADRHRTISHAKREYGIYATDVAQQAYYQAHQLNPNIQFPVPSAAGGGGGGPAGSGGGPGAPSHHAPAIGVGAPVHFPHVHNPVSRGIGLGRSRAYARRPYTRYLP